MTLKKALLAALLFTAALLSATPACCDSPLRDKTLVIWATISDLSQSGGSLLTVQEDERFDAVVYAERVSQRWMTGSDFFRRTSDALSQSQSPAETASPQELVQLAATYRGHRITLYRNGQPYATHDVETAESFRDYFLLFGLRYLGSMGATGFFGGSIEEARLYDVALDKAAIAALKVNQPSQPAPIGWWTFDDGTARDIAGHFPAGVLVGGAQIANGRLDLNGTDAFLVIDRFPAVSQSMFYQPRSRATGRMWDTWLYFRDGTYFLYYLANCGRSWDNVSLATSPDGVHWREHGVILRKRPDAVWMGTGSTWRSPVFDRDHKYYLNFSEWRGNQQTIFFAESTDLVRWKRLTDEYEFGPDARWYNLNDGNNSRWDCIYTLPCESGGLYGYWTATPRNETQGRFGFGESADGVEWRSLPPPVVHDVGAGEVGAVERIGDKYYMMFGTGGMMVTLVAEEPDGPFRPAEKNFRLLSGHTYFSRFFPSPDGLLVNHHSIARDGGVLFAPLKATQVDEQGTLRLTWWRGNEKLKHAQAEVKRPTADTRPGGPVTFLDGNFDTRRGVILEGLLALPASADVAPNGLYIECGTDHGAGVLVGATGATELGPMRADGTGFAVEKHVDRDWPFRRQARFRLLLKHSLLEFYLDDILVECFSLPTPATGRIGVVAGSGAEVVTELKAWY